VTIDRVTEYGRVDRIKNGADIESTDSEVCRATIQFSVTRKEEKCEKKRSTEAESVLASEHEEDSRLGTDAVRVLLTSRKDDLGKPGKKARKTGQKNGDTA